MTNFFSVWSLIRTSGFTAYFFMTISLSFGLLSSLNRMKTKKALLLNIHQTSGWYGFLTIIFHMMLIWKDQFIPYKLAEIFIPFYAKHAPFFSALGTLAFYLFLLVIGTSDFFIKKLGRSRWKRVHLAVIPGWMMMVIHGLTIGTDSSKAWALLFYTGGVILIFVLVFVRFFDANYVSSPSKPNNNHIKLK